MDPESTDYLTECAPEREDAYEAFIDYLENDASGMIGSMLHEESPKLAYAASGLPVEPRYEEMPPILWENGMLIPDPDPTFCYCSDDNLCGNCRDAADAQNRAVRRRIAASIVRTERAA